MQKEFEIITPKDFQQRLDAFLPADLDQFGKAQFFFTEIKPTQHIFEVPFLFHLTNKSSLRKRMKEDTGTICWSVFFPNVLPYLHNRFIARLGSELNLVRIFREISENTKLCLTPVAVIAKLPMILTGEYKEAVYELRKEGEGHELRSKGTLSHEKLLFIENADQLKSFVVYLRRYNLNKKTRQFLDILYSPYIQEWALIENALETIDKFAKS